MIDKEQMKMVVEVARESHGSIGLPCVSDCCCPQVVEYYIMTNCVTLNNGACPGWDFCQPGRGRV